MGATAPDGRPPSGCFGLWNGFSSRSRSATLRIPGPVVVGGVPGARGGPGETGKSVSIRDRFSGSRFLALYDPSATILISSSESVEELLAAR